MTVHESSRLDPFQTTLQKTDTWFKELMEELHTEDVNSSYRTMRAVLHALRDRLIPSEAADLAAQMPMLLRGLYYEGWTPSDKPTRERSLQEFLDSIQEKLQPAVDPEPQRAARSVFSVLERQITGGEIKDVREMLPKDFQTLWESAPA